ncbi:hypothetical protein ACIBMZ_30595 [Micromonospora sp. NPDC049900]|uniref:hypothetical protein n=1 Tax=Micromonospora sp. NPDC049900 TaxID=3364275 RepID=UPI00379B0BD8
MQQVDVVDTDERDPVPAHAVLAGWHSLVIAVYIVLLSRQSHERVHYDDSPWEKMWIFAFATGGPLLFATLFAGLILLWTLPRKGWINWPAIRGTVAAAPMLLLVAAIIDAVPH